MHLSGKTEDRLTVRNAVQLCLKQKWINYIKCLEKGEISEKITKEENVALYDILMQKHSEGIYTKKPNPMGGKLTEGRDAFIALEIKEQGQLILELLNLTMVGNTKANLTLINGAPNAGVMLISKNITGFKECKLIHQSITGIYEYNKMDLLKV